MVVENVPRCVGVFEPLPPLSSPSGILIIRPVPLNDHAERFSKRKLPGDFRWDRDLSIRSNGAFKLDCLHPRIPLFIIALPGSKRIARACVSSSSSALIGSDASAHTQRELREWPPTPRACGEFPLLQVSGAG